MTREQQQIKTPNQPSYQVLSTTAYQLMRAKLYISQNPGTSLEEAIRIVNSR